MATVCPAPGQWTRTTVADTAPDDLLLDRLLLLQVMDELPVLDGLPDELPVLDELLVEAPVPAEPVSFEGDELHAAIEIRTRVRARRPGCVRTTPAYHGPGARPSRPEGLRRQVLFRACRQEISRKDREGPQSARRVLCGPLRSL